MVKMTHIVAKPAVTETKVIVLEEAVEEKVILEMSIEHAKTLLIVSEFVGGPSRGRRGHIDDIRISLFGLQPLLERKEDSNGNKSLKHYLDYRYDESQSINFK